MDFVFPVKNRDKKNIYLMDSSFGSSGQEGKVYKIEEFVGYWMFSADLLHFAVGLAENIMVFTLIITC